MINTLLTRTFTLALALFFSFSAIAENLWPQKVHRSTTIEILRILQEYHFTHNSIDDEMSAHMFDNFLDTVDGNKLILLKGEIEEFKDKYQLKLDDFILSGNVAPAYDIFNLYKERTTEQINFILANMEELVKGFDYTKQDSVTVNPDKRDWPSSIAEVKELWVKRLKASALSLKLAGKEPDAIVELLTKRYENQLRRLEQLTSDDVFKMYIDVFTAMYDPHTSYMTPEEAENFDISMHRKLEGIGAVLRSDGEFTKVVQLVNAGPAFKQGDLKPSDRIVGVGQGKNGDIVDVVGWRLGEVVDLIRGPKGSVVVLEVIPASAISDDERKTITIIRDVVSLEEQTAKGTILTIPDANGVPRRVGVIEIPAFYADRDAQRQGELDYNSTTVDTGRLLLELQQQGAEAIVIDLRTNGGGYLDEAVGLTGLFISKGPVVQIKRLDKRTFQERKPRATDFYDGPLVVLTSRVSASASEIFAGAIQDYKRGIIVGARSFGKGTVQGQFDLAYGRLKLTQSKFYRISGGSTQNKGVVPDIALPSIYDEEIVGESSLEQAMPWDTIPSLQYPFYHDLASLIPGLKVKSEKRASVDPDFIYITAITEYMDTIDTDNLSLNEAERIKQREEDEAARLALMNAKRKAKGEEPLTSLDAEDEEEESSSFESEIDLTDPYIIESGYIAIDLADVLAPARQAAVND